MIKLGQEREAVRYCFYNYSLSATVVFSCLENADYASDLWMTY